MSTNYPCIFRSSQPIPHVTNRGIELVLGCLSPNVNQNKCTLGRPVEGVASCIDCTKREYPEDKKMDFDNTDWSYIPTSRMVEDAIQLCKYVPSNCAGIVGIPRSGMIAASAIAALTSKPLYELDVLHGLRKVGAGGRMWSEKLDTSGPFFVFDDSVYQGNTINLAKDLMRGSKAIFTAVYARPDKVNLVDHYVNELESPHLFEWNLYNNGMVSGECDDTRFKGGIAFDFDGVLCPDPPVPDADKGEILEQYLEYIRTAPTTHVYPVLRKIPLIITLRLEKWRSICDEWLKMRGITYDKMVMCPFDKVLKRVGEGGTTPKKHVLEFKAKPFAESNCSMMIESDPWQAQVIHEYSEKPVICSQTDELFY